VTRDPIISKNNKASDACRNGGALGTYKRALVTIATNHTSCSPFTSHHNPAFTSHAATKPPHNSSKSRKSNTKTGKNTHMIYFPLLLYNTYSYKHAKKTSLKQPVLQHKTHSKRLSFCCKIVRR